LSAPLPASPADVAPDTPATDALPTKAAAGAASAPEPLGPRSDSLASATAPPKDVVVATAPPQRAAPQAPAVATGKISFSIRPWGEILVDGKPRAVSPPVMELTLPAGRHRIEIRNGAFPGYTREVDVAPGVTVSIAHSFR
jgi:hypothetical protein